MKPTTQEIARLRDPAANAVFDCARKWVRRTDVIFGSSFKEMPKVTPSGKANAQNVGVGSRKDNLIKTFRVIAVFQANMCRIRCAGEWVLVIALGPRPITVGDTLFVDDLAVHGFTTSGGEFCFTGIK